MTALAAVAAQGGTWSGAVLDGGRVLYLCPHRHALPGWAIGCVREVAEHPSARPAPETVTRYCPARPDLVLCHDRCPEGICLGAELGGEA